MKRQRQPVRHRTTSATMLPHSRWGLVRRAPPAPPVVAPDAESQRHAEIEQELQLARDIQQGLLLEAVPQLRGWEISAVSLPARDLGGDLYDFLRLNDETHAIMIGDVSGKGLPAALRMAVARTLFRSEARKGFSPAATLAAVNRGILSDIPQGMVTMFYAMLDLRTGMLHMANAGHNFPVQLGSRFCELELTGLPLGVDAEIDYQEQACRLEYGDTIVLFTDGVIEATSPAQELYGDERLQHLLQTLADQRPRTIVTQLLHELRAWSETSQADDITLVVIRRRYADFADEFRMIAQDVLGKARASELIAAVSLPARNAPAELWQEILPALVRQAQQYGRGLARELHSQLRLVLEEYR